MKRKRKKGRERFLKRNEERLGRKEEKGEGVGCPGDMMGRAAYASF